MTILNNTKTTANTIVRVISLHVLVAPVEHSVVDVTHEQEPLKIRISKNGYTISL